MDDIDWEDISIVNENNISTPQSTGEEEQQMLDSYISGIQKNNNIGNNNNNNIEEKEQSNNTEEEEEEEEEERGTTEISNWFEENNTNSYDMEMEPGWEIPAFPML